MRTTSIGIATAFALALALAACGGSSASMPPSLDTAAHQAGVTNVVPDPSDTELYVAQAAHATLWDGATEKVELITFASKDAEDNWIKIAKQFGAVVLNQGDGWVVAK